MTEGVKKNVMTNRARAPLTRVPRESTHPFPVKSVAAFAVEESSLPSFEYVADSLSDFRVLQRSAVIANCRQPDAGPALRLGDNHLVGVGIDDEVSIVGHDNDL